MRIRSLLVSGFLAGSMAALPALAMEPRECAAGKPTAASYTWNFQKEATGLLQDVQTEASQVRQHAANLQTYGRENVVDWQSHADQLDRVRAEVNDMGAKLCRLQEIRRVLAPWQQAAIDRIAPQIRLIADNAKDAIQFANNNQEALWQPVYTKYIANLYHEGQSVSTTVNDFEEYAHTRTAYRELQKTLGMKTAS